MIIKEIDRIKGNPNVVEAYRNAMNLLHSAGIIDALRVLGNPVMAETADKMAINGAHAAGWSGCLMALQYFEEVYLQDASDVTRVRMDFGSVDKALSSGDLTTEEADAIRRGYTIKYPTKHFTSNIDIPKRPAS